MKKRLTAIAICFVLVFTMTIMSSAEITRSDKRELSSGAIATSSLSWNDFSTGYQQGYATATTSIDRAQLCNVSVTIEGTYVSSANAIQSTYSINDTKTYSNGSAGINAASASIGTIDFGYWYDLSSNHHAYYNGARESWGMSK